MEAMTFDSLNTLASARAIAMSAGDLSVSVREEVTRILKEQRGRQLEAVKIGVDRLLERDLISTREAQDLKSICELVFGAIRGRENSVKAALAVRQSYRQMLVDPHCSPTACAIASVASAAFAVKDDNGGQMENVAAAIVITPGNTGAGAVIGAVIGGVVGGIVGGGFGAAIGAAVGGAAGAAIGFCNDAGV